MTPRERLFASLEGRETDRVPVWLLFPYHPLSCYADVRARPSYREVSEASRRYAFTLNRRHLSVPLFTPEVETRDERFTTNGTEVTRRTLSFCGRSVFSESSRGAETKISKLLKDEDELETYCSFPVLTDERAIRAKLDEQLPQYEQERREFPMDLGAMMFDLGEPIGPLYGASKLEAYAVWSLTHDELVRGFLDRVMEQKRIVYRWCLEHDLADVYFLVGSELASPPLVSRATFQRWIVPYAKELIDLIHSYGKKVIQHYHGQIREILDDFVEMAPDGLHTIEAPPIGNCTFTQAFAATENRITLIGNVQYDCFRAYTPDEMTRAVRDVVEECCGKRLVLSPSAGPYEQDITPAMSANYMAFMRAAWDERS